MKVFFIIVPFCCLVYKLKPDYLHDYIARPGSVRFYEKDALLLSQHHMAFFDRHRLTYSQKQNLAMGMAITSSIGGLIPVEFEKIVRIAVGYRHQTIERPHKVLYEHRLIVIDGDTGAGMRRIDKHLAFSDPGVGDNLIHFFCYIDEFHLAGTFYVNFLSVYFHIFTKYETNTKYENTKRFYERFVVR